MLAAFHCYLLLELDHQSVLITVKAGCIKEGIPGKMHFH